MLPTQPLLNITFMAIGFLDPVDFGSLTWFGPAMSVAMEDIQATYGAMYNVSLIITKPVYPNCSVMNDDADRTISQSYYQRENPHDVTAILTAACFQDTAPYMANEWNVLFFDTVSASAGIRDRTSYPTWISTAPGTTSTSAQAFLDVLAYYKWSTVTYIVDMTTLARYGVLADMLELWSGRSATRNRSSTVMRWNINPKKAVDYKSILTHASHVSRVIIFLGHAAALRQCLIMADKLNMTSSEYVFLTYVNFPSPLLGKLHWKYDDPDDPIALKAFQSLFSIEKDLYEKNLVMEERFRQHAIRDYNFTYNLTDMNLAGLSTYLTLMAVMQIVNQTYVEQSNFTFSDGRALAAKFLNRTFHNDAGDMTLQTTGERYSPWTLRNFDENGSSVAILHQLPNKSFVEMKNMSTWKDGFDFPPPNEPYCGYRHEKTRCFAPSNTTWQYYVIFACAVALLIAFTVGYMRIIRQRAADGSLRDPWWQVECTDVSAPTSTKGRSSLEILGIQRGRMGNDVVSLNPIATVSSNDHAEHTHMTFNHLQLSKSFLVVLIQLRDAKHINVARFHGLTFCKNMSLWQIEMVAENPRRGTIQDALKGPIRLDISITSSFIVDLLEAIQFIHSSTLNYHGHLSPTKCWLDRHLTLKIACLAMDRIQRELCNVSLAINIIPSAPEELWYSETSAECTAAYDTIPLMQKRDIYSSGIIIYELLTRVPMSREVTIHQTEGLGQSVEDAINFGTSDIQPYEAIIKSCWNCTPAARPTAGQLRQSMSDISPLFAAREEAVVDKILRQLAGYSEKLEREVVHRTEDLTMEMKRCDRLIAEFLPRSIVKLLRNRDGVTPEYFNLITMMFTDLHGFDQILKCDNFLRIIEVISDMEAIFDHMTTRWDVYKVEAVSDSYLVASGLPVRNGMDHVWKIARFALEIRTNWNQHRSFGALADSLYLRMGIHSGPCAAGVVGTKRLRYCLFGDTINVASRMCSHGVPDRVHLSSDTAHLLVKFEEYNMECRGVIYVKGKGNMPTYWLTGMK